MITMEFISKIWKLKENGKVFYNDIARLEELQNGFYVLIDKWGSYSFHTSGYANMIKDYLKMEEL